MISNRIQHSQLRAWEPTTRTHLLHIGTALFLTPVALWLTGAGLGPYPLVLTGAALACLPLASVWPYAGAAASIAVAWVAAPASYHVGLVAACGCWGVAGMLLARQLPRHIAYPLAVAAALLLPQSLDWATVLVWPVLVGVPCLALGEIIRNQREQVDALLEAQNARGERQRRMVTSELHDTVVRDLTHTVMVAQSLKAAYTQDQALVGELDAIINQVRRSVEQLRRTIRVIGSANEYEALLALGSAPPRPLAETLSEARQTLEARGVGLSVEGSQVLEGELLTEGTRQQVLRVVNELVGNAVKYAAPGGGVTVLLEADAAGLQCMVANPVGAQAQEEALSSGIGLELTRHRVEILGGRLLARRDGDRWVSVLTVPLQEPGTGTSVSQPGGPTVS